MNEYPTAGQVVKIEITISTKTKAVSEHCFKTPGRIVKEAVAKERGVSVKDLEGPRRTQHIAISRHMAAGLMRQLNRTLGFEGRYSFPQIAQALGGRDHTTIIASERTLNKLLLKDEGLAHEYANAHQATGLFPDQDE